MGASQGGRLRETPDSREIRLLALKPAVAERGGFEPPVGFPTPAFQASALDHSATSPKGTADNRAKRSCGPGELLSKDGASGRGQRFIPLGVCSARRLDKLLDGCALAGAKGRRAQDLA